MGSNDFYPEERPVRRVTVAGFWMDEHLVTNTEYRRFVRATSYLTLAERQPVSQNYPDADPGLLVPGSLVFRRPPRPITTRDHRVWWSYMPGACWRHPEGPGSNLNGRDNHPVTHIAYEDALAYATWAGKSLPLEAEWEFAARGGLEGAVYPWGDELLPRGRSMANTWQGEFPWQNLASDGYEGTSPVRSFPPNGYGLFDMVGNVWEWTSDYFSSFSNSGSSACCASSQAPVDRVEQNSLNDLPGSQFPRRVIKGGSHLCAPNYCLRYRPAARQGETVDSSTSHLGFRCVTR